MSTKLVDDLMLEFSNLFVYRNHICISHISGILPSSYDSLKMINNGINISCSQPNKNDVDTSSSPGAFPSSMLLIAAIISSLEIDIFKSSEHPDLFRNKSFNSFVNNPVFANTFWNSEFSTSAVS